jgi:hypothetical protein
VIDWIDSILDAILGDAQSGCIVIENKGVMFGLGGAAAGWKYGKVETLTQISQK